MAFRRRTNSAELWRTVVHENTHLLSELPRDALANEKTFRDYVTTGTHQGVRLMPSVFELSDEALSDLWVFIQHKGQFDMDAILFDSFDEAFRRRYEQRGAKMEEHIRIRRSCA